MSDRTLFLILLAAVSPLAAALGVYLSRLHFPPCRTCGRAMTRYSFNGECVDCFEWRPQ